MSLARQFLREFRPLFRMLEEPLGRHPGVASLPSRSLWEDPFINAPFQVRPAVDVSEEGNQYVVEAELPGVKKEDVEVRVGDGGRSVTIEGKILQRATQPAVTEAPTTSAAETDSATPSEGKLPVPRCEFARSHQSLGSSVVKSDQPANQLSVERAFTGSSTFTRTVWLPRAVDVNNVSAKLADGVLTLRIPKAVEAGSVRIDVE